MVANQAKLAAEKQAELLTADTGPKMKYNSISEEYDAKTALYEKIRAENKKKSEDAIRAEIEAVKNKNEQLKRIQAIELRHAKLFA